MDATKRTLFLRKIHLFHDLTDDQLSQIGEKFSEKFFDTGDLILKQGAPADTFYLIYSGKVRVHRKREKREQELAVLVSGDYFGEMEIFGTRGVRSASITAIEPTLVLYISSKDFGEILTTYPNIKPTLEIA